MSKIPEKWMNPVLTALKELGGSGRPKEITEIVAKNEKVADNIREETNKNGSSKFDNQVAWARQHLVNGELIDDSKRGVWTLTPLGQKTTLTEEEVHEIYLKSMAILRKPKKNNDEPKDEQEEIIEGSINNNENLLDILKSISWVGFEHLCKRLLREHGFENLVVTQRSRDEGIDGYGKLETNPFISTKVVFQCKRYKGTVSREKVGDFRNAVMGRADKGIMITTGVFSEDAKREANREGVIPIELIDGEKLVELFQQVELGLKQKTIYEIDYKFFEEYYEMK
ncbi:MAG: restriction endonuclease [Fibromonadaceae bacterium]|jgi:restriction system protein|nr:restriction endonuclease [Fibromonadaceae bacterium]